MAFVREGASLKDMERNESAQHVHVKTEKNEETKEQLVERLLEKSDLDFKCCGGT
ncbi:MAG TPA: hypothetical protein VF407_23380 [Polyangiaceae bacterium]